MFFLTRFCFLNKLRTKHRAFGFFVNNNHKNVINNIQRLLRVQNRTDKRHRKQKDKKKGFVKEQVENADLYKSVMNKIMTKHE